MTENLPPDPAPREEPSRPGEGHSGDSPAASDEGAVPTGAMIDPPERARASDGIPRYQGGREYAGEEGTEAVEDQALPDTATEGHPSETGSGRRSGTSSVAARILSSPQRGAFRGMGWKMMAVGGAVLLLAGFAAGLFYPGTAVEDPATEQVAVATTRETVPPTTSAPTTTSSSTTTSSPSAAAVQTVPDVVSPPDLVVTDEPVADVAERLVPSVVHLEVRSDNVLEQGAGSGVIFSSSGYILTAAHVVAPVMAGQAELTVRLANGDRLPGEVVGADPDSDIAVVGVERSGLVAAEFSLLPPRVGQLVVAVGSPWGLESSVTSGVISATDRIVDGRLLIQSDAVLYPGNSGGALADRYGRLVGINVSIFTDSTTLERVEFQGVGFAVPMALAYRVAQALIAGDPVHTAFLGVSGRDSLGDAGVEIMEVFPGSGAETAGVMVGDVIVAVDGRPVTGISDLAARIRHRLPGEILELNVLRGEEEIALTAALLPRSEVMGDLEDETPPELEQQEDDTP